MDFYNFQIKFGTSLIFYFFIFTFELSYIIIRELDDKKVQFVTDLVFPLSSHATLRQLTPWMLLSQPPPCLACYAQLLPTTWMQRELTREHLEERNFIKGRTPYNALRSYQLWRLVGVVPWRNEVILYLYIWNCLEPWMVPYNSRIL